MTKATAQQVAKETSQPSETSSKPKLSYAIARQTMLIFATTILLLLLLQLDNFATANNLKTNNNNNEPASLYIQRPDTAAARPQLMVAIYCGAANGNSNENDQDKKVTLFHNQYLDLESKKWKTDRNSAAFCTTDKREILNYCKKVYPNHDIRNIVESSQPYKIENWCKLTNTSSSLKRRCRGKFAVKPYRCLEGSFQSDALLVPERCLFDHEHNKSLCEGSEHWNKTATDNCRSKAMALQSFGMLQPCEVGLFSGVEFVCCPTATLTNTGSSSSGSHELPKEDQSGSSFARAAGWSKDDEKMNEINSDDKVSKKHSEDDEQGQADDTDAGNNNNPANDDDEEDDEEDEDEYDDDSSSWNRENKPATTSTTTTSTTTTTTTTERPIEHYMSHFDLNHEHDDFRKVELAVESNYRDKITKVMHEWSQLDSRYEEMKKKEPEAAEEFKRKMTQQFQKAIATLEKEGADQRHQLASMHAERAMALINRRKKAAMDCLTQALDRDPIRTRQVERCIVKLLKALEKDRSHTLHQYRNLLNLNTREALRERKPILDHLVTLNRAANQSIAMLDRSPVLVEKLKSKIIDLWHKLRNVPLDEPIVRESELKTMEKYEEEVAQKKIERERQRLYEQDVIQDPPQESPKSSPSKSPLSTSVKDSDDLKQSNNIENQSIHSSVKSTSFSGQEDVKEITGSQQPQTGSDGDKHQAASVDGGLSSSTVKQQPFVVQQAIPNLPSQQQSRSSPVDQEKQLDESENEIHYQLESAKFSHLKMDPTHNELSYSVKHDSIGLGNLNRLNLGSILFVSCALVLLVTALAGFKYYNKRSTRAYRRQGFAEVGRSCPEEKSVASMQHNGFENPAYKYFEAEA